MVITPVEFSSVFNRSAGQIPQTDDIASSLGALTGRSLHQENDRFAIPSEFQVKLDEFIEQIKLDSERLLMFGDEPEESEDSKESTADPGNTDFTTYQMVLEAGQRKITETSPIPQSNLHLLA